MKSSRFILHAPKTVSGALELLATMPNPRALAGGQSLMPMLNMRLTAPDHLVDLNDISEMSFIRDANAEMTFGAMTRQRDIEFSDLVAERLPLMREAILNVGHRQTRNRGTFGGSLCHLDPSAELPTVAMALDATLDVANAISRRSLTMAEFIQGFMTSALRDDELLLQIRVKPWSRTHGSCFLEFARRHGDFAIVSAAAMVELDAKRRMTRVSLTLGGVGPAPVRLIDAETALIGGYENDATVDLATRHAAGCEALGDPAYPSWYRQRIAGNLIRRAIRGAFARAGTH